jgi:peptide deformylase
LKLDGISARVVLHELDHLNGVTFDMVAKPLALKMAKRGREKKIKSFAKELVGSRRF